MRRITALFCVLTLLLTVGCTSPALNTESNSHTTTATPAVTTGTQTATTTTVESNSSTDTTAQTSTSQTNTDTVPSSAASSTANATQTTALQQTGHTHTVVIDAAVAATCSKTGLTEGKHCSVCHTVLVAQTVVPVKTHQYEITDFNTNTHTNTCIHCGEQKTANHTYVSGKKSCTACPFEIETPPTFAVGFVTTEMTYIETEYVLFEIEPNIYVVGDLAEKTDTMCRGLETITGLSFKNGPNHKKPVVHVQKTAFGASADSEFSGGVARFGDFGTARGDTCRHYVTIESTELFLGRYPAFLHEMVHVLRFCQTDYHYNTVLEEGFAAYVVTEALAYFEKHESDLAYSITSSCQNAMDLDHIVEDIYSQEFTKWFERTALEFTGNDAYIFGAFFMQYLKTNYGNFTAWMTDAETYGGNAISATVEQEIAAIKAAFGDSCIDGFYPWLKKNAQLFNPYSVDMRYDMSGFKPISIYPVFVWTEQELLTVSNFPITYQDLCVNVEEARHYLKDYKNRNVDDLYLALSSKATIRLYDKNGVLLDEVVGTTASLKGVSYFKLVGKGKQEYILFGGYYNKAETYTKETVIYSTTLKEGEEFYWRSFMSLELDDFDYDLLFRRDVTLSLRFSAPCTVWLEPLGEETVYLYDQTSVVVSGCYDYRVMHENKQVTVEVIVTPKK